MDGCTDLDLQPDTDVRAARSNYEFMRWQWILTYNRCKSANPDVNKEANLELCLKVIAIIDAALLGADVSNTKH